MPSKLSPPLALLLAALMLAPAAEAASGTARTAALQVALRGLHLYRGPVDGVAGPGTRRAVRRLQRRRHLAVDGMAGPRTRRALGWRGRPSLGHRQLRRGRRGWDVSELQFLLRRRGVSPDSIDGGFGAATRAAVRRFQRAQGLRSDGIAGHVTIRALKHPRRRARTRGAPRGPVRFLRPVDARIGDRFG
jgi:peptidoglycan hydrolase-like protein with peptidoglycan-binding domain